MQLRACSACKRHIAVTERACPFCAAASSSSAERRPVLVGRVSRATIHASTTLAGAALAGAAFVGCWTSSQPPRSSPPDPIATRPRMPIDAAVAELEPDAEPLTVSVPFVPPPPPPPIDAGLPDAAIAIAPMKRGTLSGVVTDSDTRSRLNGVKVECDAVPGKVFKTDAKGRYKIPRVPGGWTYIVFTDVVAPEAHPVYRIGVKVDGDTTFDVGLRGPRWQDNCCINPYGAPSARRRVV